MTTDDQNTETTETTEGDGAAEGTESTLLGGDEGEGTEEKKAEEGAGEDVEKKEEGDKKEEKKEEKKAEDKKEGKADKKAEAEVDVSRYDDLKFADEITVNEDRLKALKVFAAERDMDPKDVQALADMNAEVVDEVAAQIAENNLAEWGKIRKEWRKETEALDIVANHKEGPQAAVATAKEAVKALGGAEFEKVLNITGAGDNPYVFRALYALGSAMKSGDVVLAGDGQRAGQPTQAQKIFHSASDGVKK